MANKKNTKQWIISVNRDREVVVTTPRNHSEGFLMNVCIIDGIVVVLQARRLQPLGRKVA